MSHPTSAELIELHFSELSDARRGTVERHLHECADCRQVLTDLAWVEQELDVAAEAVPPSDGLERVLARIDGVRPVREKRIHWLRAALPCSMVLMAGALAAQQGGPLALLAFFVLGSIVTLALAPMLILESQRRSS